MPRTVEVGNTFQPKWIEFVKEDSTGRKTELWYVKSKDGESLGRVKFYPHWRKYSFFPFAGTVYEQDCLWDIADFCARKTKEWRDNLRAQGTNRA